MCETSLEIGVRYDHVIDDLQMLKGMIALTDV